MLKLSEFKNSNQEFKIKHKIASELIKAQKEGKIHGLFGRLGDLGAIDQKYDIAISTACNQLDYLVVDNTQNARNILNYLRNNNIGTASIIILEKVSWVERYFNKAYQCPPGTQRLFDLVKFEDKRLQNAFYFALRDTLVTSNLETATKVGYGQNRHRVVTLDGVIVEITGAMVGGGKPRRGLMSNVAMNYNKENNEQEIKKLNEEYVQSINEYNQLKNDYNGAEQEYQRIIRDLRELETVGIKLESDLNKINQALKEVDDSLKTIKEQSNKSNADMQQINRIKVENEKLTKENENLKEQTKELRKELTEINNQLDNTYGDEYNQKKNERDKLQKEIDEIEKKLHQYENVLLNAQKILDKLKEEMTNKEKNIEELKKKIKDCENIMKQYEDDSLKLLGKMDNNNNQIKKLEGQYTEQNSEIEKLKKAIANLRESKQEKENEIKEINEEIRKLNRSIAAFNEKINTNKISFDKLIQEFGFIDDFDKDIKMINQGKIKKDKDKGNSQEDSSQNKEDVEMKESNKEESNNEEDKEDDEDDIIPKKKANIKEYDKYFKVKELKIDYPQDEINKLITQTKDIEYLLSLYESQLKNMKPNMQAIIEYKKTLITLRERESDLTNTVEKLQKANDIYQNVKQRRQNEFMEGFNIINTKLIEMYRLLTKGGDAELELADSLDPFNEGITFTVRPNRKCWKSMGNLSGGEKTLSSLSLIFALHHYKPSPLYFMDEIDAALDFRNVSVIAEYIKERTKDSQFIIISLRNQMFELANELIGIYKTFDITKVVVFDPNSYDVKGRQISSQKSKSSKKQIKKDKDKEMEEDKDNKDNNDENVNNENSESKAQKEKGEKKAINNDDKIKEEKEDIDEE
jgi:structural maintenance of chromosome 4